MVTERDKVLKKSAECTMEIFEAKKKNTLKMTNKLEDPNTTRKTCWTIFNRFLYNKENLAISPLLVDDKFFFRFSWESKPFQLHFYISMFTYKKRKYITIFFIQNKHQNKFFPSYWKGYFTNNKIIRFNQRTRMWQFIS